MNYYMLLVVLVIISALLMRGTKENNKAYVFVASLLLFSIFGLRDTFVIGNDSTSSYLHLFQRMSGYSWGSLLNLHGGSNAGFYLLTKLFYQLGGGDYQFFITSIALYVTVCFGFLIYRYSPNPLQSILYHFGLFFFTFHFSALKQSLAMATLMLAFDALVREKKLRFFLLVLIAGQFHFPAHIFFLAYPMSRIRVNRRYLIALAGLLALTYLLRNQLINLMLNLYSDLEDSTNSADLSGVTFLRTKSLVMLVIIIAGVMLRKPKPEDRVYSILLQFMGLAVVFQTFCGYNNIFERLADYYFQFSVLFIPMVFDKKADREPLLGWRYMSLIDLAGPYLFCGYAIYRFLGTTKGDANLFPFKFFFAA
ncbi:MAG: EpsG family protein [Oscillospiraceae bacterium]|nr:EpsG family protein [Oscillospiraceae bacterium]